MNATETKITATVPAILTGVLLEVADVVCDSDEDTEYLELQEACLSVKPDEPATLILSADAWVHVIDEMEEAYRTDSGVFLAECGFQDTTPAKKRQAAYRRALNTFRKTMLAFGVEWEGY